ncbi:hypothetical protein GCM10009801_08900 [Streptomyces albiaxialis]|uniref:Uncharacterized protein n=1 Tax=Streptomyces albiaxialis TaxID=329523 RepID=A0ABN2VKK9_9ACTN
MHQAVRIDRVRPVLRRPSVPVTDAQPAIREDAGVQHLQIDGALRAGPPGAGVDEDAPAGQLGGGPVGRGQGGHHLAQGRTERALQAERRMGALGGQHEQGTRLVGGQPGDVRTEAGEQGDAAVPAALGVDGHSGGREGLDVAVDRAGGHLQALGQFGGGNAAPGLEKQQDRQETVGFHVLQGAAKT